MGNIVSILVGVYVHTMKPSDAKLSYDCRIVVALNFESHMRHEEFMYVYSTDPDWLVSDVQKFKALLII